ncbi:hypothetical protein [Pseudodesulfovibrio sp.]|uniref:hypothetical protein n=1 Tax=unclassified Pseudodesulfovibrio TaxID=2661612 RepID=UPI003B00DCC6
MTITKSGSSYKIYAEYPDAVDRRVCKTINIEKGTAKWQGDRMLLKETLQFHFDATVQLGDSSLTFKERGMAMGEAGNCDLELQSICTKWNR